MVYKSSDSVLFDSSFDQSSDSDSLREMKYYNREAFGNIDIPSYLNKKRHRVLLMHVSRCDEQMYVAYPGGKNNKNLPGRDFIPLVYPELTDLNKLMTSRTNVLYQF